MTRARSGCGLGSQRSCLARRWFGWPTALCAGVDAIAVHRLWLRGRQVAATSAGPALVGAHVWVGGTGPTAAHGMVGAGNSFGAAYDALSEHATVVVPDLLGLGGSLQTTGRPTQRHMSRPWMPPFPFSGCRKDQRSSRGTPWGARSRCAGAARREGSLSNRRRRSGADQWRDLVQVVLILPWRWALGVARVGDGSSTREASLLKG